MTLEMNFSESTFLEKQTIEGCSARVRIFTPAREITFAGHPTLGTAFVMKYKDLIPQNQKTSLLQLGVGPTHIEILGESTIQMTQPEPSFGEVPNDTIKKAEAIGLTASDIDPEFPVQVVSTGFPFLIVPIKTLTTVKRAAPVSVFSDNLRHLSTQLVLIFSTETEFSESHVHTRMFEPEIGVVEDPATGSATGPLGAYLVKYQTLGEHKIGEPILIEQGFEIDRPSQLVARIPNEKMSEVYVSGIVRLIAEGIFYLP